MKRTLDLIKRTIGTGRFITLRYRDATGNVTRRKVRPIDVRTSSEGDILLLAYCALRDEPRTFRLDRIESAKRTDTRSKFGQYVMKVRDGMVLVTHLHDMVTVQIPPYIATPEYVGYLQRIPTWRERNVLLGAMYNASLYDTNW